MIFIAIFVAPLAFTNDVIRDLRKHFSRSMDLWQQGFLRQFLEKTSG